MKRREIVFPLLLVLSLLLQSSCAFQKNTEASYMYSSVSDRIMRYDTQTGQGATLCADSLCTHDSMTCQFYGSRGAVIEFNGHIYYVRSGDLYDYDLSTSNAELIDGRELAYEGVSNIWLINESLYYNMVYYIGSADVNDDLASTQTIDIYRFDIKEKKIVKLNESAFSNEQIFIDIDGDRLCWVDQMTSECYTTNFEYTDRKPSSQIPFPSYNDEYAYIEETSNGFLSAFDLYSEDLRNGNRKLLEKNVLSYRQIENKIVFIKLRDNPIDLSKLYLSSGDYDKLKSPDMYYTDNNIYIMDYDGDNKHLLCQVPDTYYFRTLAGYTKTDLLAGDYIGIRKSEFSVYSYTPEGSSDPEATLIMLYSPDIILINIKTGNFRITESSLQPM